MFISLTARKSGLVLFVLLLMAVVSCHSNSVPVPINYGNELCARCGMVISDMRYGAEIVSSTGKVYKFDSVECMATYYMSSDIADKPKVNLYVTDFAKPNTLIDARAAVYLQSPNLPSPMAKNLSAFKDRNELEAVKLKYTGTTLTWNDVLAMLARTDG